MSRVLPNQIALDLFETPRRIPGNCPDELSTVDIGGGKSLCKLWDRWTNCREVGYCVYSRYGNDT